MNRQQIWKLMEDNDIETLTYFSDDNGNMIGFISADKFERE